MAYRNIERWVEFGICCIIILTRVLVRIYDTGFRGLKAYDYVAVFVFINYVVSCVIQEFADHAYARLTAMSVSDEHNPAKISADVDAVLKFSLASVIIFVIYIYSAKVCLLLYYSTFSQLWQNRRIFVLASICCAIFFLATMGTILAYHSRFVSYVQRNPFSWNYGFSYDLLCLWVCHVLSDIFLLAIPYPIIKTLWDAKIPWGRKLLLSAMVCSGIFTVSCATIVFVQFFANLGTVSQQAQWPRREQFVWMIILNLPSILSIFRGKILSNTERHAGTLQSLQTDDVPQKSLSKA